MTVIPAHAGIDAECAASLREPQPGTLGMGPGVRRDDVVQV
jgi:hypothetical protein